jgi:hypothetical protein
MNLKKLVKLANHYDLQKKYAKADALDLIIKKASEDPDFFEKIKNSLSQEEAESVYNTLNEKLEELKDSPISFKERIEEIKMMKDEMLKVFEAGYFRSGRLISNSLSVLDIYCDDKPEDYLDTIKRELFSMFGEMVFSGLSAYQLSGYDQDKSFGYYFVDQVTEMKFNSYNKSKNIFAHYIMNQDAIITLLKSMKPEGDYQTGIPKADPIGREDVRKTFEEGYDFANKPEAVYRELEEKEDPFYEDEEE